MGKFIDPWLYNMSNYEYNMKIILTLYTQFNDLKL